MESTKNEFSLIVAWKKMEFGSQEGVNQSLRKVSQAVKNAKLVKIGQFPLEDTNKISPHLTNVRILNAKEYVTGGCSFAGHSCAILNRETTEFIRKVAADSDFLHNFLCYGQFIIGNDNGDKIHVFDMNSESKVQLPGHFQSSLSSGYGFGLNCGVNMEIDESVGYLLCTKEKSSKNNFLMRFDFKHLQELDFEQSVQNLKTENLFESLGIKGFCLSKKFVYVIDSKTIVRIKKKSRFRTVFRTHGGREASLISRVRQIVANDQYVYGCTVDYLVLIRLEGQSIKALAKADCPEVECKYLRSMNLFTYKGVTFVGVCYEKPFSIALYVHYGNRLFRTCHFNQANEASDQPMSLTFDEQYGRLIICKEFKKSLILQLQL